MPEKCDPGDPARCQAHDGQTGQCENRALPGCRHCELHDGKRELAVSRNRSLQLRDAKFAELCSAQSTPEALKSLREEIAIVSGLFKERVNSCTNKEERDANAPRIMALAAQAASLKQADLKMQIQFGELLARATTIDLGMRVADILEEEIAHVPGFEEIVDRIVQRIAKEIISTLNKEK